MKEQTGVSHDQLQAICTVQHLRKIAPFVGNYLNFATRFSLLPGVLAGIETDPKLDFI